MIQHVKHVTVAVKDQDRAVKFYTEKLGFEVVVDVPFSDTQRWIELKIPGAETQVVLFTAPGEEYRIGKPSNVIFTSENIAQSYEELKRKGVEFLHPPKEEPWGTYTLFKDPDGNTFCISSS
jgi:catechol 2,3-dioxygenase-like lactoylglutathione lyase family enzyme